MGDDREKNSLRVWIIVLYHLHIMTALFGFLMFFGKNTEWVSEEISCASASSKISINAAAATAETKVF